MKTRIIKKKNKKGFREEPISLLHLRIMALETERQLYEQNPNLMNNLKMMNIALIQNDILALRNKLRGVTNRRRHRHLLK